MAITRVTYEVTRLLFTEGLLPKGASILEFGEANWHDDVPVEALRAEIDLRAADDGEKARLNEWLDRALAIGDNTRLFEVAKVFYALYYGAETVKAIDLEGTEVSIKHDLNQPVDLGEQFDVTINNGTAEHIFFAGNVFASMHRCTKPGGLMIHEGPLISGWVDHGFFNFQPTLFFDLAHANAYETMVFAGRIEPFDLHHFSSRDEMLAYAQSDTLPKNPVFMVVFRKDGVERDFTVPAQGYYARTISDEARAAWERTR